MHSFVLWAPSAQQVEMEIGGERTPMTAREQGWWSLEVPSASPGSDYTFVIDGGKALPDPRSPWQPNGIVGPSRVIDHEAFSWTDQRWQAPPLSAAVLYELHVGTFTSEGTFRSAIEGLQHLVDLGITHIELMPVVEFPGNRGWGYDGVDLFAPHHSYGSPDDLKRLVDACHKCGLAVILDVVYNHLGPTGNYLAQFGPYFTARHETPWGPAINFDGAHSDEVRRFFCDNAFMWLRDYHFDGLRLDAIHAIVDTSALHFLEQVSAEIAELEAQTGRHLVLIAESDLNDPRVLRSRGVGGYGIHAQWNDDFHHALHTALSGEHDGYYADFGSLPDLAKALQQGFVYDQRYSTFRRRRHGKPLTGVTGHSLVGYMQNHDQIGNRATGDRSSRLMNVGRLKIAAALVITAPSIPMLFQGEEWGATSPFLYFTDHQDPELARAVTDGRRREFAAFGWSAKDVPDPQARETFTRSKLNWNERFDEPHAGLLAWHRDLIKIRRQNAALSDGRLDGVRVTFDESQNWLVVQRGPIVVACNLNWTAAKVPAPVSSRSKVLLSSNHQVNVTQGSVELGPDSVAILKNPTGV